MTSTWVRDSLAHSHNSFIQLNIKATGSHVFELGEKTLLLLQKSGGLVSTRASQKVGGLKPSGLIDVYAYGVCHEISQTRCGRIIGRSTFVLAHLKGKFLQFDWVKNVLWCHVTLTCLFSVKVTPEPSHKNRWRAIRSLRKMAILIPTP